MQLEKKENSKEMKLSSKELSREIDDYVVDEETGEIWENGEYRGKLEK